MHVAERHLPSVDSAYSRDPTVKTLRRTLLLSLTAAVIVFSSVADAYEKAIRCCASASAMLTKSSNGAIAKS